MEFTNGVQIRAAPAARSCVTTRVVQGGGGVMVRRGRDAGQLAAGRHRLASAGREEGRRQGWGTSYYHGKWGYDRWEGLVVSSLSVTQ